MSFRAWSDRPVDRVVYKLYGLTDDEIAIVEGARQHSALPEDDICGKVMEK